MQVGTGDIWNQPSPSPRFSFLLQVSLVLSSHYTQVLSRRQKIWPLTASRLCPKRELTLSGSKSKNPRGRLHWSGQARFTPWTVSLVGEGSSAEE